MQDESVLTPHKYIQTERMLAEMILAAAARTEFGKYYPDADVTIRYRNGKILPVVEIRRRAEK